VKSDFCSTRDFATGKGVTTRLFMQITFTLRRTATVRVARKPRLSLTAHDAGRRGYGKPWSWLWNRGCPACTPCKATAREHSPTLRGGDWRQARIRSQTSARA
jgi:hypothetical protein